MGDSKRKNPTERYAVSFVVGVLILPLLAVAAVAVVPRPAAQQEAAAPQAPPPTAQLVLDTTSSNDADLEAACGAQGQMLWSLETAGTITPIQQAALDALRVICDEEGRPLTDPAAVLTAEAVPGTDGTQPATTQTPATSQTPATQPPATQARTTQPPATRPPATQPTTTVGQPTAQYTQAHDAAVAAIAEAVAKNGKQDKINEARQELARAEQLAAQGSYSQATQHCWEAIGQAREATGGGD